MFARRHWLNRIEAAWDHRSVVWLYGVRRVGKTMLCQSVPEIEYFDLELPSVRREAEDPERFLARLAGRRIALDEVHRLANPSELLKIAADHYPDTRVVATGSSTLHASAKFKDTLAGRKSDVWLTPMITDDVVAAAPLVAASGLDTLDRRLLRGGLPPFYLASPPREADFQEWMEAYWARDIQELFRVERRASFLRFVELVLARSGGVFEATAFAAPCEVSRPTIANYLAILEATRIAHVVRPYSTRRSTELVAAPKVYAFDTGFVAYHRGWRELRSEDRGLLWEHYVLNEIQARFPEVEVRYWRDARHKEVDFVVVPRGRDQIAIECKWSAGWTPEFGGLKAFRRIYADGDNFVVCADVDRAYGAAVGGVELSYVGIGDLVRRIGERLHA